MNMHVPEINLLLAWLWILLGFVSGCALKSFSSRDLAGRLR